MLYVLLCAPDCRRFELKRRKMNVFLQWIHFFMLLSSWHTHTAPLHSALMCIAWEMTIDLLKCLTAWLTSNTLGCVLCGKETSECQHVFVGITVGRGSVFLLITVPVRCNRSWLNLVNPIKQVYLSQVACNVVKSFADPLDFNISGCSIKSAIRNTFKISSLEIATK